MKSITRSRFTSWLLVPVIAGLLFTGLPVKPSYAVDLDPVAVREFAKAKGLDSLREAIKKDAQDGKGLPLLLDPAGNQNSTTVKRNVPLPQNLQAFLNPRNKNARLVAAQLGKALFWDMQLGSDGQSCASCHFHAGADNRVKNQLNPDVKRIQNVRDGDIKGFHFALDAPDFELQIFPGHNYTFKAADFPFVTDIGDGDNVVNVEVEGVKTVAPAAGNTNDVASSMGVFWTQFQAVDRSGDPEIVSGFENFYNPFALGSDLSPGRIELRDQGEPQTDPAGFQVPAEGGFWPEGTGGKTNVRRVEPRNTPTTINAVFNTHNFWDGRANFHFNGVTPHGRTDRDARIFVSDKNVIKARNIEMKFASLASQAVGPPLSDFEMSFFGRIWPDVGKKMVGRYALATQTVDGDDSLLGSLLTKYLASPTDKGLNVTYGALIKEAFNPSLYNSDQMIIFPNAAVTNLSANDPLLRLGNPRIVDAKTVKRLLEQGKIKEGDAFSLMEANFSFFFGVAVMLYEAELVADDSPLDKFMAGNNSALNASELLGLAVFVGFDGVKDGRCINCHGGPEMTNVSIRKTQAGQDLIEPMIMADGNFALYDAGFYNVSVTPTAEDVGRGGRGPDNKPLASSRQFLFADQGINGPINFPIVGAPIMNLKVGDCVETDLSDPPQCIKQELIAVDEGTGEEKVVCIDLNMDGKCGVEDDIRLQRVAVDGAFKTPGIRNQELQGPYFHNGGFKTLVEVAQFYDRGGNFCKLNFKDLDPDVQFIGLSEAEEEGLVAFMIACTDERVRYEKGPFDRPELRIPNGHPGDHTGTTADALFGGKQAEDVVKILNAVGKGGVAEADKLKAFHVGLGLDDGLAGHLKFGADGETEVASDVDVDGAPKCNMPPKETP
ncbi:MAG TPA: cytochrome c peroxidase [Desulfobaccales bacterium]|nr:cytochrome c peroxidase [Desulfobaccales bacterium]